jgi:hypothetical protein
MKKILIYVIFMLIGSGFSRADIVHQLDIFTNTGQYAHNSSIDLYFKVVPNASGIDFTFHNDSTVSSSIAGIYFDDIGFLTYNSITNGTGTAFNYGAAPGNLPAGNNLTPSFQADYAFGADSPATKNGINPGEWVTISFNLKAGNTSTDVINALNNHNLRVGVHLIGLPDGSSESAVQAPEPATVLLLGLGALVLRRKQKNLKHAPKVF